MYKRPIAGKLLSIFLCASIFLLTSGCMDMTLGEVYDAGKDILNNQTIVDLPEGLNDVKNKLDKITDEVFSTSNEHNNTEIEWDTILPDIEWPDSPDENNATNTNIPDDNTNPFPELSWGENNSSDVQIPENSSFAIHFIDVGQADATLIQCDGKFMLIDGGNPDDSEKIKSALLEWEVQTIDYVVATHLHNDHIGSINTAYDNATVKTTLCPAAAYDSYAADMFLKKAKENSSFITPQIGDTYNLGSASFEILWVDGGPWEDINNTSIILKITYGNTSFLFTGDAEREAELAVLDSGADISADVLKVGHHGSSSSTSYVFLREIMPAYAVISVGAENEYGHPHDNVTSRLQDADVTVFRTDLDGDIYCTSDGEEVVFH